MDEINDGVDVNHPDERWVQGIQKALSQLLGGSQETRAGSILSHGIKRIRKIVPRGIRAHEFLHREAMKN